MLIMYCSVVMMVDVCSVCILGGIGLLLGGIKVMVNFWWVVLLRCCVILLICWMLLVRFILLIMMVVVGSGRFV